MSDEEVAANKQLMAADLQDERSRTRAGFKPAAPEDQANGQRKQAAPRKAQTEAKKDGRRPTLTAKAKAAGGLLGLASTGGATVGEGSGFGVWGLGLL